MDDRLLLDKIDYENKCIAFDGGHMPWRIRTFLPWTRRTPYALTEETSTVIDQFTASFRRSERLQKHVRFLYSKGNLYKIYNGNLLFHGCIPLTKEGQLMSFKLDGVERKGKDFMDRDDAAR